MTRSGLLLTLWQKQRALLLLMLLLGIGVAGLLVANSQFVQPRIAQQQQRMQDLQQQIRQYQQQVTQSGVPLSTAERLSTDLRKFNELIPPKQQFSDFLGDLFIWAERSDLDIRQVAYRPKIDPDSGLLNYGLSFSVSGDYAQLKRFIHLLENSRRVLIIEQISLVGGETETQDGGTVSLQIQLTTFFREAAA